MKRALFIALFSLGSGWVFALTLGNTRLSEILGSQLSASAEQRMPDAGLYSEIYAASQEKPQSLSGAPFKAGDSETFGIKDTSKKGLPVAAHLSPHLNPPPQGGRKEGGEEGDFIAAIFAPLRL